MKNKLVLYGAIGLLALFIIEKFRSTQPTGVLGVPATLYTPGSTASNVAIGVNAGTSILNSIKGFFGGGASASGSPDSSNPMASQYGGDLIDSGFAV